MSHVSSFLSRKDRIPYLRLHPRMMILGLSSWSFFSTTGGSSTSSWGSTTTRWNRGKFFFTFSKNISDGLARKFRNDLIHFFFIGIDTDASEDDFDGSGIWSIVSTELSKKIGSDVTHFKLVEHETNVYLLDNRNRTQKWDESPCTL